MPGYDAIWSGRRWCAETHACVISRERAHLAATSLSADAQNRTIIEERPTITVPLPVPSIEVERRERVERRDVETTGRGGCDSKTVRKEGPEGSKTVTKKRCD